jgi:hypothetical protein
MKYSFEINVEIRHCVGCPLRTYDNCLLLDRSFSTWEEQMANCPLGIKPYEKEKNSENI